jgi:signal transduction histidine kinase
VNGLTGLRLDLDAVEAHLTSDPRKAHHHLSNARQSSAEVITDQRNRVSDLRPPAIDHNGHVAHTWHPGSRARPPRRGH